ncbi:hypothetical protein AB0J74_27510 [Asanoa sp. NPDC049573]|uniref:hypothetical protein n=1 Tax=Asanoa sp. NPDC049573 TaxID=3155396 RepID=UPI00343EA1B1
MDGTNVHFLHIRSPEPDAVRSCSAMAGPARSRSTSISWDHSATRAAMASTRRSRSTSWCPGCQRSASTAPLPTHGVCQTNGTSLLPTG